MCVPMGTGLQVPEKGEVKIEKKKTKKDYIEFMKYKYLFYLIAFYSNGSPIRNCSPGLEQDRPIIR